MLDTRQRRCPLKLPMAKSPEILQSIDSFEMATELSGLTTPGTECSTSARLRSGRTRQRIRIRSFLKQYAQFCIVGGTGVVVDMAVIWFLASPTTLGWNVSVSKILAAEVAILNNFIWNDVWTFSAMAIGNQWSHRARRFIRFNIICLMGIGLSAALVTVGVYWLRMNLYFANLLSIILVSLWNFAMNLKFGWSSKPR